MWRSDTPSGLRIPPWSRVCSRVWTRHQNTCSSFAGFGSNRTESWSLTRWRRQKCCLRTILNSEIYSCNGFVYPKVFLGSRLVLCEWTCEMNNYFNDCILLIVLLCNRITKIIFHFEIFRFGYLENQSSVVAPRHLLIPAIVDLPRCGILASLLEWLQEFCY